MKPARSTLRFLALGDSYTIGEAVAPEDRWINRLASQLRADGLDVAEPRIIAKTGWTTDELLDAIIAEDIRDDVDLATLLIGVNNQYRGRDPEEYRAQFKELLESALSSARNDPRHILVLSIPDWGVTPFAEGRNRSQIAGEIDRFNRLNKEEAARAGVLYLDITPMSREAGENGTLLAGDGLHPSGKMYERWAAMAYDIIRPQFVR